MSIFEAVGTVEFSTAILFRFPGRRYRHDHRHTEWEGVAGLPSRATNSPMGPPSLITDYGQPPGTTFAPPPLLINCRILSSGHWFSMPEF